MDKEYKTLVNKALERFHFRISASGTHAELAARESLTRAIKSIYDTPMPFGCGNPLTHMFNQLLKEARA